MRRITKLTDVVDWRLCIGCGACAYVCPDQKLELWDFFREGIRPVVAEATDCGNCRTCLEVCPAVESDFNSPEPRTSAISAGDEAATSRYRRDWGHVLEVWEGYANDPDIRYRGSSGGALTALSAYCLEAGGMHGVLQIAQRPDDAIRNRTQLSRTRGELLAAMGSRYAPASVCDSLDWVEDAPGPCVVVGKPAEMVALRKAQALRPGLNRKVGAAFSFFCAESPSTEGTAALLNKLGVATDAVETLRYRGHGWPGHFAPTRKGESEPCAKMTYQESWAFLQRYRPWSIQLWPDGIGEMADITCGDPWYDQPDGKNPGFSLIVVRTETGRKILHAAMAAGYLTATPAEPWKLAKSQPNLLDKKRDVWGRLFAMRLFLLPVPRFVGANLFSCWLNLPLKQKFKSILATAKRIVSRKLYRPLRLDRSTAVLVRSRRKPVPARSS